MAEIEWPTVAELAEQVRRKDRSAVEVVDQALADLALDIRHARVQTLGPEVVDTFYVRDSTGAKVTDAFYLGEIQRALLHAVGE